MYVDCQNAALATRRFWLCRMANPKTPETTTLRFHPVTGILLGALSPQIEVVRVGLTESWRRGIRVVMRQ